MSIQFNSTNATILTLVGLVGGTLYLSYQKYCKRHAQDTAQTLLAKAEAIFENYHQNQAKDPVKIKDYLIQAYSHLHKICKEAKGLPKQYEQTAAKILYLYGRCLYGGQMEPVRQLWQLSLAVQLVAINRIKSDPLKIFSTCDQLELLAGQLQLDTKVFIELDSLLMQADVKGFAQETQQSKDPFLLGMTIRWLEAPYQNLSQFAGVSELKRFEQLRNLAYTILEKVNTKESRWQMGQIIYNIDPFIQNLKTPNNFEGELKILSSLDPFTEGEDTASRQLRAQRFNKESIILKGMRSTKTDVKEKQEIFGREFKAISSAAEIAYKTLGIDPFLKAMFYNNYAATVLDSSTGLSPVGDVKQAAEYVKWMVEERRKMNFNHCYDPLFVQTALRVALKQKNRSAAVAYLKILKDLYEKYQSETSVNGLFLILAQLEGEVNQMSKTE